MYYDGPVLYRCWSYVTLLGLRMRRYWLNDVTKEWFDEPIREIIGELEPASISKSYLTDLLLERNPELAEMLKKKQRKYIFQCVTASMKKMGYEFGSKRNKTFWRSDLV